MKFINVIAQVLLIIGGLNWGLVGLFQFNLVDALFGAGEPLTRVIYIVVGIAAIWGIYLLKPVSEDKTAMSTR